MSRSVTPLLAILLALPVPAWSGEVPRVTLGGEVGAAAEACITRFRSAPFDSLPWLRADLTGEQVSEFDKQWGHPMSRPFKQYSGDISGRFIEIMAMNSRGSHAVHPAFKGLLEEVLKQQRPGGYFCSSGTIDWQLPIDYAKEGSAADGGRMMPALWGNSRLLCGLVETMRSFPGDAAIASATRKLGDFYLNVFPRFTDPGRIREYTGAGSYAAGYVTCWFPAMEGLVKLSALTGERKYLDAAIAIAAFYQQFDRLPIDHAHGMLCNQVSLLLLFEATKDPSYLARVEKRWDELVTGGYINPAGGILEKCWVNFQRDEGCAIADWLRLNLALARVTGKARYWAMAERTLHNHLLQNQTPKGGFGHRHILCDGNGAWGFEGRIEESTWCCTYHGELAFLNLRAHLVTRTDSLLTCNFALDFTCAEAGGKVVSTMLPPAAGELARQRIQLDGLPAAVVRVRQPHWADAVAALGADGTALPVESKDGYCATSKPVVTVEFVFAGGVYAEDRRCTRLPRGPEAGQPFVIGYGPKLMAAEGRSAPTPAWPVTVEALKAQGMEPFPSALRRKDCCFVSGIAGRPNVLFIASDDMRPQLGCYGDTVVKSPNLDRLAGRGMVFANAYCQQALCSPSRISLLTGRHTWTTRIRAIGPFLRETMPDVVTLPQHFKDNGYFTRSLGKIYHVGIDDPRSWSVPPWHSKKPRYGPLGASMVATRAAALRAAGEPVPQKGENAPFYGGPAFEAPELADDDLLDGDTTRAAIDAIRELANKPQQPFFLAVGFANPHVPWVAPQRYFDLYQADSLPLPENRYAPRNAPAFAATSGDDFYWYANVPKDRRITPEFGRQCLHGYLAAISYVDACIGRLLAELDRLGLRENTVVVFWGDHGYYMGEHNWWGGKHNNYEGATRAPLIVAAPGREATGARCRALVEFVDIYPSLVELCGLPQPKDAAGLEGKSFAPLLDDPTHAWDKAAFSEYPKGGRQGTAMRTDRYRYVEWRDKQGALAARELYDHQSDPQENENVAGVPANQPVMERLSAQLRAARAAASSSQATPTAQP